MQGLGETAARLSSLRKTREGALAAAVGQGAGALVETPRFGSNPGALRMLSYAPAGLPKGAPLVVLLHGCTQRAEGFAVAGGWLELADRCGFAILAPEQSSANNPNRCFNWFSPQDARRGQGEAASIRSMVAAAIRAHESDPARVFVTGLSAGGAMTMVMLAAYPEVFAAGAVVAGLPYGGADNVSEAMMAMQGRFGDSGAVLGETLRGAAKRPARTPRLSIWHGDADAVVRSSNAAAIASQWAIAYGLAPEPDEVREPAGRRHAIWRSPATGEVVMESHLLQGLGHGVPLATSGADGLGAAAPYMIEHGVSSTWEIARFWGIAEPAEDQPEVTEPRPILRAPTRAAAAAPTPHPGLATDILEVVGRHVPVDVQAVIAKALKSAGLMK
jgi:poly(hydroxyalkanoate) depolymerase family esterase